MSSNWVKYVTKEQKELRHIIRKIDNRMTYHRKQYQKYDLQKQVAIGQLRKLGIEYGQK